jgi:hypothetical protein
MKEKNEPPRFTPEVPTKSESNTLTVIVGVVNSSPFDTTGIPSCQSMSYTVGSVIEPADYGAFAESPEAFSPGAVGTLKKRLSTGAKDSGILHDASGDY